MSRVAIVVALEREVRALIKEWRACEKSTPTSTMAATATP